MQTASQVGRVMGFSKVRVRLEDEVMVEDRLANQDGDDDEDEFWKPILEGARDPVEIIYLATDEVDLEEIEEWGEATGLWTLRLAKSTDEAIREHEVAPADLMIL